MFNKPMEGKIISGDDALRDDWVYYASLLFAIDDWLLKHFYDAYGDPLKPNRRQRFAMARLCLRYIMNDSLSLCGVVEEYKMLSMVPLIVPTQIEGWLEEHNSAEGDRPDVGDFVLLDLYADVC